MLLPVVTKLRETRPFTTAPSNFLSEGIARAANGERGAERAVPVGVGKGNGEPAPWLGVGDEKYAAAAPKGSCCPQRSRSQSRESGDPFTR